MLSLLVLLLVDLLSLSRLLLHSPSLERKLVPLYALHSCLSVVGPVLVASVMGHLTSCQPLSRTRRRSQTPVGVLPIVGVYNISAIMGVNTRLD